MAKRKASDDKGTKSNPRKNRSTTTSTTTTTTAKSTCTSTIAANDSTSTPAATLPPGNEFDAILGEAQDLLKAAAEAQSFGRLKMASAYMLLLHARLVGLGKRFDRTLLSKAKPEPTSAATTSSQQPQSSSETDPAASSPSDAVAVQLAKYIPQDIELDTTMMEHLARAAMELHHKRTNKSHPRRQTNAAANANAHDNAMTTRVAWSREEHERCIAAKDQFGIQDAKEIARAVGTRTETEVRAHLRNVSEKEKLDRELAGDGGDITAEGGGGGDAKKKGKRGKPPPKAVNTNAYEFFDAKRMILKGGGLPQSNADE